MRGPGRRVRKQGSTSYIRKHLLRKRERRAHQLKSIVFEVNFPVMLMERIMGAIGHLGLRKLNVGFHDEDHLSWTIFDKEILFECSLVESS
jgi:hypothetical protein